MSECPMCRREWPTAESVREALAEDPESTIDVEELLARAKAIREVREALFAALERFDTVNLDAHIPKWRGILIEAARAYRDAWRGDDS